VFATAAAVVLTLALTSLLAILVGSKTPSVPLALVVTILRLLVACWVGWLVWKRPADRSTSSGLSRAVGIGVAVVGGIGFCGGFFGPLLFDPQANQGPLLGIFITGPIGAIVGGIGGAVYWGVRRKREADTDTDADTYS